MMCGVVSGGGQNSSLKLLILAPSPPGIAGKRGDYEDEENFVIE